MKKNLSLLFTILICTAVLNAQDTHKVFASPTLVYYGIDFTKAKMIGFGDESPHKIRDEYFRAWNSVSIDLDLTKTFQKNAVAKDPNGITKLNSARETETLKSGEDKEMTPEVIAEIVKSVPVGNKKEGLGCVIIAQSFDKTTDAATAYVTFFDIATHSVLLSKKVTAKPGSGSPSKAWTSAVHDIFSQIEKKEFKAWKKEMNY